MKKITYCEAITEALTYEMERDKSVIVYGIGVPDCKNIFGSTKGLQEKFGKDRVFDTPLSEDALTGFGIGVAMNGMRPVHIHIRADFALLAMNQIINMASAIDYISNGQLKCPMVIRIIIGRGWGQGFQHSKSLFSLFTQIPELKVIAPSNPMDVKTMLIGAIRDNSPVICFEHRWLYWQEQYVGEISNDCFLSYPNISSNSFKPILYSSVYGNTVDITLLSYSWGVVECKKAANIIWQTHGVSVDVIDLRVLSNLDIGHIHNLIKCDECIIVEDDWLNNSVGAGFLAQWIDEGYRNISYGQAVHNNIVDKHINFSRIGWKNTPCPTVRNLEDDFYYNAKDIVLKITNRLGLRVSDLSRFDIYSHENHFKGPF